MVRVLRKGMSALVAMTVVGVLVPATAVGAVTDLELGTARTLTSASALAYGASGSSYGSSVSDDGTVVAFMSSSGDLVEGVPASANQIYAYNRTTGKTVLVSVAPDGTPCNGIAERPAISGNGRYVTFQAYADNLVPGAVFANNTIYRHDLVTGETIIVSVGPDGVPGNGQSFEPVISDDGNRIAWYSTANDLVEGDTSPRQDVFVRDIAAGTTIRVSCAADGTQGNSNSSKPAISGNGAFVAFESHAWNLVADDTNGWTDVFVCDLANGTVERVSVATGGTEGGNESYNSSISDDGSRVAFASAAGDLVPGDANGQPDIFVRDRVAGTTTCLSAVGNNTSEYPFISGNGVWVSYKSAATNLVPDDTNGLSDVFVANIASGAVTRVSVAKDGSQSSSPSGYTRSPLSDDGTLLFFDAERGENLLPGLAPRGSRGSYQVFLAGTPSGTAGVGVRECITNPYAGWIADAEVPVLSGNQRYVFFRSIEPFVAGSTSPSQNVYRYDLTTGAYELVSCTPQGVSGNQDSGDSEIAVSYDGRYVVFGSYATDLVPNDTNNRQDVFLRDMQTGFTTRISAGYDDAGTAWQSSSEYSHPSISADGRYVTFQGRGSIHLATERSYTDAQVFLYDRLAPAGTRVRIVSDGVGGWNGADKFHEGVNQAKITADGKWVLLRSKATIDLPEADASATYANLYLRSLTTGETIRVTHTPDGGYPSGDISKTSVSADGSVVTFQSKADGLVESDSNGMDDIFVWSRATGQIALVTHGPDGASTDDCSSHPSISPDGKWIAYQSWASNLTGEARGNDKKLYLYSVEDDESALMDVLPGMWSQRVSLAVDNAGNAGLAFAASGTEYTRYGAGDSAGDCDGVYYAPLTLPGNDSVPPVISGVSDKTAEAVAPGGAYVKFSASAADDVDGTLTPKFYLDYAGAKTPVVSGAWFVAGVTEVTAEAIDAAGNVGTASFTVTVADTTAPAITRVSDVVATATSPAGALVGFTASAWDAVDGAIAPRFFLDYDGDAIEITSPAVFPVGTTVVTAEAIDAAGNIATATFTVAVLDTDDPVISGVSNRVAEATGPEGALVRFAAVASDAVDGALAPRFYLVEGDARLAITSPRVFPIGTSLVAVEATDSSGNVSAATFTVTVQDTTAPYAPGTVRASAVSSFEIALTWREVSDPSGVAFYTVYTAAGVKVAEVTGLSHTVTALAASTAHGFYVTATDGAGHESVASRPVSATTFAGAGSVYRFYNVRTGTHFYTASAAERDMVIRTWPSIYTYEGVAYTTPSGAGLVPLHRFYNAASGTHFYTASSEEAASVRANLSSVFMYEGVAYQVYVAPGEGRAPVYRFYSPRFASHFYTASAAERDSVIARFGPVYTYEGIGYWVAQ